MSKKKTTSINVAIKPKELVPDMTIELPVELSTQRVRIISITDADDRIPAEKGAFFVAKIEATNGPFKGVVTEMMIPNTYNVVVTRAPKKAWYENITLSNVSLPVFNLLTTIEALVYAALIGIIGTVSLAHLGIIDITPIIEFFKNFN
jgi:hypothetical protein